ncbi:hypothetical protein [Ekhidna sp.]|uniref:hypothetical protein n=1 Tax=Ekhidna sp. TaxID=2608089 RepID=UPI003CCC3580
MMNQLILVNLVHQNVHQDYNLEALDRWLGDLSMFSGISGILFFIYGRKHRTNVSTVLVIILVLSFLADTSNYFFVRLILQNSYIIGNIWLIANYFAMLWLFSEVLDIRKSLYLILGSVFATGGIISFGLWYTFLEFNTFTLVWSNITFIFLSLIAYFQLLRKPNIVLAKQPVFWISTSFFVYYCLIFLQSIFNNYLIFDLVISDSGYTAINMINHIANISKNFVLFYALILLHKGFPGSLKSLHPA